MILAQITDLHITRPGVKLSGIIDTANYLRKAVAKIVMLNPRPDALLITGDLVNDGTAEEYKLLREILAPIAIPTYIIPGNHDEHGAMRSAFADHTYLPKEGFIQYVIDSLPVRIIALDTVVVGVGSGALDAARLSWLEARLEEAHGAPVLIMMHHPPFTTGIAFMDAIGLIAGRAEFAKLVERFSNVERILCGHVHRAIEARIGSAVAMTCPATCHQIPLELRENGPEGFTLEPPALRLHVWNGSQFITHLAPIGDFPGPYDFSGAHQSGGPMKPYI